MAAEEAPAKVEDVLWHLSWICLSPYLPNVHELEAGFELPGPLGPVAEVAAKATAVFSSMHWVAASLDHNLVWSVRGWCFVESEKQIGIFDLADVLL